MPGTALPPSPIALNMSPTSSIFKRKSTSTLTHKTAASYLSALSEADARRAGLRANAPPPVGTPALSLSSSVTGESEDSVLREDGPVDALEYPSRPPTSEQVYTLLHSEYGHCNNEDYRFTSEYMPGESLQHVMVPGPYYIMFTTYISYLILIVIGHIRDFFGKRFHPSAYRHLMEQNGYAPLNSDWDSFYTRRLKQRMDDCFGQPITGVAGRTTVLLDRYSTDYNDTQTILDTRTRALNISSYNYLGFAQSKGGCADAVEESIRRYGVTAAGSRLMGGSTDLHTTTEALVARFVGQEDAMISSMGFSTNSAIIPALVGKGCLVISDELNHASIRFGVRFSGANVRTYKHNDMRDLEALLREVISQGQPKTHRPWKKILLIVEGLFSMEGTFVDLPRVLELKRKYKFFLWVDEAHSIGAVGPNGRGVTDFFHVNPREIDILMGTFTKSFGAAGGYVSGSKAIIDRLRVRAYLGPFAEAMAPPVLMQIIASMASIMGVTAPTLPSNNSNNSPLPSATTEIHPGPAPQSLLPPWLTLDASLVSGVEGRIRLRRIAFNSRYLRAGLAKLGFITYGHSMSPVVPLLLFNPGKMIVAHRLFRENPKVPIITVVVTYPACDLMTARIRFCVSASHTKEDIDEILRAADRIGDVLDLKHGIPVKERWGIEEVCERAVELSRMEPIAIAAH
ncbi:Serine palmitoyltransferase 2 [Mycena chlorophos]|uniref:serine C-palmitoyltransferase n=1 Tax=Mycena chlorophos TaxID=658473 RepID=A0A8H6TMI3_MYCCL|nr:Serine palmitoyltransferase 2 [Mycena chlorophos]